MEKQISEQKSHMVWIDWMKVLGIYFIIVGHIFPVGKEFVYAFSVPLFFLISSFLSHREEDCSVFWQKLWYNLIVPMLLFTLITYLWRQASNIIRGNFDFNTLWILPLNILVGNGGQGYEGVGLIAMCFVYSLCILKIILQYLPKELEFVAILVISLFCVAGSVAINDAGFEVYNAWPNTSLAFPFFALGYASRQHKQRLNNLVINYWYIIPFVISLIVIYECGIHNGIVYLYRASYGGNYIIYLLSSFAGIFAIFTLSKALQGVKLKSISLLGGGTIIILGAHQILISILEKFRLINVVTFLDYLFAFLILIAFIPIIKIIRKYVPILYGTYRVRK